MILIIIIFKVKWKTNLYDDKAEDIEVYTNEHR